MNRRIERVGALIRNTVGELLLSKLSDPRVDPARTSITRVEVTEDFLAAKVFISVLGSEGEQTRTLEALRHAAGRLQELMMRQIRLRHTPVLMFEVDKQFKKTLATLNLIEQAMTEIRQKEQAGGDGDAQADVSAGADEGTQAGDR